MDSGLNFICPVTVLAKSELVLRTSMGSLVSYGESYYVITTFNAIKNNLEIEVQINKIYKMKLFYSIEPYDFTILRFSDPVNFEIEGDLKFQMEVDRATDVLGEGVRVRCEYDSTIVGCVRSELFPPIPLIVVRMESSALSGSLVMSKNNILGMVTYNIDKVVYALSAYCIVSFFMMGIKGEKIRGICVSSKVCEFENKIGHYITKSYPAIKYDTNRKKISFRKDDLIETIDELNFNENGDLYLKDLAMYVPLDTYIALRGKEYYGMVFHRRKGADYKLIDIKIAPVAIEKYLRIHLEYAPRVIKYRGLEITEFSEQLYQDYVAKGIKLAGYVEDYYTECFAPRRDRDNDSQKLVVVKGIDYSAISQNIAERYKFLGLPLIAEHHDDSTLKYYMAIITKINNKKIIDLEDLEKQLFKNKSEASPNILLRFALYYKKSFNILYDHTGEIEVS
ncbi:MAG: hypothetical protein Hyperionvirus8_61 [Hyperionvirus sp.]|uniref:Uncharacterized protein n=1 Tax=Hyperionvirus sp. TaxID=2487770 RepID=A0A3G5A8H7_9VIRU|nr:MAG: hypothetical protein Hyperionvirus8_61 [Hyperionvirus sp.]